MHRPLDQDLKEPEAHGDVGEPRDMGPSVSRISEATKQSICISNEVFLVNAVLTQVSVGLRLV